MSGKLPSRNRAHANPVLRRIQQNVARNMKPVNHQIMEAEVRAKKPSPYKEGELERRGLLKQVANEDLSENVSDRLMWVKHDKHTFRQVITRKGKKSLRSLLFHRLDNLFRGFRQNPRDLRDLETLNAHRSRVLRVLSGKSPDVEIFVAMIPLFEYMRKRAMIQKSRAVEIIRLLEKGVKPTRRSKKLAQKRMALSDIVEGYNRTIERLNKKISWMDRMAGRVEKGIDVSGAAEHFIREVHDNLVDYNVTD